MTTLPPENDGIADETIDFDINLLRLGGEQVTLADDAEDLERTRVSSRRRRVSAPAPDPIAVDDDEHTRVVDRSDRDEHTVVVDRSQRTEDTVAVDRSDRIDNTVVVERAGDDTVVVARATPAATAAPSSEDDDTAVVRPAAEKSPASRSAAPGVAAPVLRTRGDRRRGIAPPPVPAGFAPAPKAAVGPGAVESYPTRPLEKRVEIAPAPLGGVDATRDPSHILPSASKRAQRLARVSVAAFAAACLVSIVGLIAIADLIW